MARTGRAIALAWAGWGMRVPPDWRPLSVAGTWRRGTMMLGDAAQPLMQVKWYRPPGRFNAERWIRRRVRKVAGRRAKRDDGLVELDDFPFAASVTRDATGEALSRRLWYGYAPQARLALELVIDPNIPTRHRRSIDRRVLPSLTAADRDGPTRWAVFDVSFTAPGGFVYRACRLYLGDIALCFAARGGRRLLLRQVYPSPLGLSRREPAKWLGYPPFKEHRKTRPFGEPQRWTVRSFGRMLEGILLTGRKMLPWPLGFIAPRWTAAAAVEDPPLQRLLLAEYDAPDEASEQVLAEAVGAMNWAKLEDGAP